MKKMNNKKKMEIWELWYSKAAAAGLSFARSAIDEQTVLLVHAAPPHLTVEVVNEDGVRTAYGKDLEVTQDTPIARLTIHNGGIERVDIWPGEEDIGRIVILPGGEAGVLQKWWNAEDHSEWRWQVEFYNHR
jgi:hypothetical protein